MEAKSKLFLEKSVHQCKLFKLPADLCDAKMKLAAQVILQSHTNVKHHFEKGVKNVSH